PPGPEPPGAAGLVGVDEAPRSAGACPLGRHPPAGQPAGDGATPVLGGARGDPRRLHRRLPLAVAGRPRGLRQIPARPARCSRRGPGRPYSVLAGVVPGCAAHSPLTSNPSPLGGKWRRKGGLVPFFHRPPGRGEGGGRGGVLVATARVLPP